MLEMKKILLLLERIGEIYEGYWIRYFRSNQEVIDLYWDLFSTQKGSISMKKKVILMIIVAIALVALGFWGSTVMNKKEKTDILTSSQLAKAIDISQLSTAEFVYNGVAEKYSDENPKEAECYISYNANVKVGIQMEDVEFKIDEKEKTVTPVLPKITVNIATLDEEAISYIPKNPDLTLKEIITLCKEDAMNEANSSEKLYQTAEENLRAVIEALLSPILDNAGYSVVW